MTETINFNLHIQITSLGSHLNIKICNSITSSLMAMQRNSQNIIWDNKVSEAKMYANCFVS